MTRYLPGEAHPHQHIVDQHRAAALDAENHEGRLPVPRHVQAAWAAANPRPERWRMGIDCDPIGGGMGVMTRKPKEEA